jgi:hypothetical protein
VISDKNVNFLKKEAKGQKSKELFLLLRLFLPFLLPSHTTCAAAADMLIMPE